MKLRETIPNCQCDRLAQRVARLEEKLLAAMERIAQLEQEREWEIGQVPRLQQLATLDTAHFMAATCELGELFARPVRVVA